MRTSPFSILEGYEYSTPIWVYIPSFVARQNRPSVYNGIDPNNDSGILSPRDIHRISILVLRCWYPQVDSFTPLLMSIINTRVFTYIYIPVQPRSQPLTYQLHASSNKLTYWRVLNMTNSWFQSGCLLRRFQPPRDPWPDPRGRPSIQDSEGGGHWQY